MGQGLDPEAAAGAQTGRQPGAGHPCLHMPARDAMLFDFFDNHWHFGLDGAIAMVNADPDTPLLLQHWGCVDAPDFPPLNDDPVALSALVVNLGRIIVLAPGEPYTLHPLPS